MIVRQKTYTQIYIKYIAKFIEIWYSIKELEAVILKAKNLIYQGRYN